MIVDVDSFGASDLRKAGYAANPLEDGSLAGLRLVQVPIDKLTLSATKETGLGAKDANRCKNMFALGLVYWLYGRPLDLTLRAHSPEIRQKARGGGGESAGAEGRV